MAIPIGLNINNPQSQQPISENTPAIGADTITYGGNVLGSGSSSVSASASSTTDLSTILIYGAIGLFVVFILQRLDK